MLSTVGIAGTTVAALNNATPGRATDEPVEEGDTHPGVEDPGSILVQLGDLDGDRAIIWGRANCPARLHVEIATDGAFSDVRTVRGPAALSVTNYTARVDLKGLPRGGQVFYRVLFDRLNEPKSYTDAISGSFRTPPEVSDQAEDLRFLWGGDAARGSAIERESSDRALRVSATP